MKSSIQHPLRTWSILLAALVATLALSALALTWLWPEDDLHHRLTHQTSEWLGVPIHIRGNTYLQFWPRLGIHAEEVTFGPEPEPDSGIPAIAELQALTLSLRWLPLLRGHLVPDALLLDEPTLHLDRDTFAALNLGPRSVDDGPSRESAPFDLRVRDGEVHWYDKAQGRRISIAGVDLTAAKWRWSPPVADLHPLAGASMNLTASIDSLRVNTLILTDLTFDLTGEYGVFRVDDGKMSLLQSPGTGEATLDFSTSPPTGTLDIDFDTVELTQLPDEWLPEGSASGQVALRASLES
ncbi:MAG TPA: AsmA family protein, partial [Guyparkeria sp.]|nr:AsmA family protein [Guyparkeria sp.]